MPSNQNPHSAMSANEWGKLRSFLARRGFSQAQIKAAIGDSLSGRRRAVIADELRAWLKIRPKA